MVFLALLLGVAAARDGLAHSLDEVEGRLAGDEKYFQPIDNGAPAFTLAGANGNSVGLADFADKVVVLHFIYASCPDVCPLHAELIAAVQKKVNRTPMKEHVRFLSITTDPRNDTAEVLKAYGPARGLDPANWRFLTVPAGAPEDATRALAARFGHKFSKTPEGFQIHGVVTHVIARGGRWRANFHGLKFMPANLVLYLNALANEHDHGAARDEGGIWNWLRGLIAEG